MSEPRLLTGREPARQLRDTLRREAARLGAGGRAPSLTIVRAGDDDASAGYARQIVRTGDRIGVAVHDADLGAPSTADLVEVVAGLGADEAVDGVIVPMPLPDHLEAQAVALAVPIMKDVDRISPAAMGALFGGLDTLAPATAAAVLSLLDFYAVELEGRRAVVIGRSNIVGKPVAALLLGRHATVTVCHSRTVDLAAVAAQADVLVVAAGRRHMVDARFVKPGAVVIDVGTNYADGKVSGDVDLTSASEHAAAITPVPGGVGPLTNYVLMQNLLTLVARTRAAGGQRRSERATC